MTRDQLEHIIRAAATIVPVRGPGTRGATGWCLEIHDLIAAKLVAGREKDVAFFAVAVRAGLVDEATLRRRLDATTMTDPVRSLVHGRVRAAYAGASRA